MKKLLLLLTLALLAACSSPTESVVSETVLGKVIFIDENSVDFCVMEGPGALPEEDCRLENLFAEGVKIQVYEGDTLAQIAPEKAMGIMLSSDSSDYDFSFVLADGKVLEMTQVKASASEKVAAPQPFYIKRLSLNENGSYRLTQRYVNWLSEAEGSCLNYSTTFDESQDTPLCNPNGFLLVESDFEAVDENFPASIPVYGINLGGLVNYVDSEVQEDGSLTLSMAALLESFERDPDFFEVTPFELEYGTVTVDGLEMTDQITALKEIYIP